MKKIIADHFQEVVKATEEDCIRSFIEMLHGEFEWVPRSELNLVLTMEGWNIQKDGITLQNADETIPGEQYESWISVYLVRNGHILSEKEEREVPSSCVKALSLSGNGNQWVLTADDLSIQKFRNQLWEVLEDWKTFPQNYQESRTDTARLLGRAKHYRTVF